MIQLEVTLSLPDALAQEAERAGLLTPRALETLLREEVRRRRIDELFAAADRLAALNTPPMTQAQVESEIAAARAARRTTNANRR